jgi:uncharacterized protein HemX
MTANGSGSLSIGNGKVLNWPTLVLVLVTGAGNWFTTQNQTRSLSYEQQEALSKIRELHRGLEEFQTRQKQELELLTRQAEMLKELKK